MICSRNTEVADKLAAAIRSGEYALIVCNFATLIWLDIRVIWKQRKSSGSCGCALGKIAANDEVGGALLITVLITAMQKRCRDEEGNPHTQHSLNPVPLLVANKKLGRECENGDLSDLAPTILKLLGASGASGNDWKDLF